MNSNIRFSFDKVLNKLTIFFKAGKNSVTTNGFDCGDFQVSLMTVEYYNTSIKLSLYVLGLEEKPFCAFSQEIPNDGRLYIFQYTFGIMEKTIEAKFCNNVNNYLIDDSWLTEYDPYDEVFELHIGKDEKALTEKYKRLKKEGLVNTIWDDNLHRYILVCEACHFKGNDLNFGPSSYSYGHGRVIRLNSYQYDYDNINHFEYLGSAYAKLHSSLWTELSFFSRDELKEYAKKYYPKNPKWEPITNIVDKINGYDPEAAWVRCGKAWEGSDGKIFYFKEMPTIGSYRRVYSLDILNWYDRYDFDKIFESHKLSLPEIKLGKSTSGGAIRRQVPNFINDDGFRVYPFEADVKYSDGYERVVTLGYRTEYRCGSEKCPVCDSVMAIGVGTDKWKTWKQRREERKYDEGRSSRKS